MAKQILDGSGIPFCGEVSSSIENFSDKIYNKYGLTMWDLDPRKSVIFFGMYHPVDYLKLLWCRGGRVVYWMGSDTDNLTRSIWGYFIRFIKARHYCENWNEAMRLARTAGIECEVKPLFFEDIKNFPVSFKSSNRPKVFLSCHYNREEDYGIDLVERIAKKVDVDFHIYGTIGESHDNVFYHGSVSQEQFNEEIKNYQCGLRLNKIDGFSEVTAKSILMGQYPISYIQYPYIDSFETEEDLINLLNMLKLKDKPNLEAREVWVNKLSWPLL